MSLYSKWYSGGSGTLEEKLNFALDAITTHETSEEIYDFLNDFFRSQPPPHPIFNHNRYNGFGDEALLRLTPSFALATLFLTSTCGCQFVHAVRFGLRTSYQDSNGKVIRRFWLPDSPTDELTNRNMQQARTVLHELAEFVSFALTDHLPSARDRDAECWAETELVRTPHLHGRRSMIYINKSMLEYDSRLRVTPTRLYQQWLTIGALLAHELAHALTNAIHGLDFNSPEMRFEHDEFAELGYAFTNYVIGGNIGVHLVTNQPILRDIPSPGWLLPSNTVEQNGERYPVAPMLAGERYWVVPERVPQELRHPPEGSWN